MLYDILIITGNEAKGQKAESRGQQGKKQSLVIDNINISKGYIPKQKNPDIYSLAFIVILENTSSPDNRLMNRKL